jgi:hypothetical protein
LIIHRKYYEIIYQVFSSQYYEKQGKPQKKGYFFKFGSFSTLVFHLVESLPEEKRKKLFITRLYIRIGIDIKKKEENVYLFTIYKLISIFTSKGVTHNVFIMYSFN